MQILAIPRPAQLPHDTPKCRRFCLWRYARFLPKAPYGEKRRGRRHRRDERPDSLQTAVGGGFGWAWRRVPGRRAVAAVSLVQGPSPIVNVSPSISLTTLMRAP
jgi:hypothetical protein